MIKKISGFIFTSRIAALLILLLLLLLPIHVVPVLDDFYFLEKVQQQNLLIYIAEGYMNWDGRYLSLHTLLHFVMMKHAGVVTGVFIWSGFFYLYSFILYRFLSIDKNMIRISDPWSAFTGWVLFTILLWVGFSSHIADTVYWAAGGGYIMSLAMVMGWLYFYRFHADDAALKWLPLYFVFSLFTGLVGVIGSFPLLIFILWDYLLQLTVGSKRTANKWMIAGGAGLLLGTLANVLAPGNFIRGSVLESSFQFHLSDILVNLARISVHYSYYSLPAMAAAAVWVVISPFISAPYHDQQIRIYPLRVYLFLIRKAPLSDIREKTQWFLMAFASILPMLAIPEFAGGRTTIFFMAFLFTGLVVVLNQLVWLYAEGFKPLFVANVLSAYMRKAVLFLFITAIVLLGVHHWYNHQLKKEMLIQQKTDQILKHDPHPNNTSSLQTKYIPFSYKINRSMGGGLRGV